ncbi:MAG: hypothetical protein HZA50_04960 [Planctomycetes bacterium]|nr:hypothetical protein [Planctomycetota bacterium]
MPPKEERIDGLSGKKMAAIAGIVVAAVLLAVTTVWYLTTDRAKASLTQAMQKADVSIAAQDYVGARKTLEDAIAAFPNRYDKAEITAPAQKRLQVIAAKTAEQEALAAITDIKTKMATGDYQKAIDAANKAIRNFSDTPSNKDLLDLLAIATEKLKNQQTTDAVKAEAEQKRKEQEAKVRHERFIKYRDEGDTAFNAATPNYTAAVTAYEKALVLCQP